MHESNACFWRHCKTKYAKYLNNPRATRLEVGSFNVNGSLRVILGKSKEHIGVDFRPGRCVDVVCLAHEMDFGRQFDAVISASMLEHDPYWKSSIKNMLSHLKDDGILVLSWGAAKNKPHGGWETPAVPEVSDADKVSDVEKGKSFYSLPAGRLISHLESLGVYIHKFHYEGNFVKHQWGYKLIPADTMYDGMGEVCLVAFKDKVYADGEQEIDKLIPEDDV